MNANAASVLHRQPHPSPHRARVGGFALWFAILAAPTAWSVQLLVDVPIAAHNCYPDGGPLALPVWSNAAVVAMAITIIALVISLAAGLVAWRSWSRTRTEQPGSGHHLIEAGQGRTRFMAMVGMICSGLFLIALLFDIGFVLGVPVCG